MVIMLTSEERRTVAEIMRDDTKFSASSCVAAEILGLECENCSECEKALAHHLAGLIEPINGETSDGYHTFNELYHHRAILFSVIVRNHPKLCWKSKKHSEGDMYEGMFIVGINTPDGQASYHYDIEPYWNMFECEELEFAPEWDGHTPDQAIERISKLMRHEPELERTCTFSIAQGCINRPACNRCGYEADASDCDHWLEGNVSFWEYVRNFCDGCGAKVVKND